MELVSGSSFNTYSRAGFIKACHILAKGLSFPNDYPLVIGIAGTMNVGKALIADAFINALNENRIQKYDVPYSPKMAFESEPAQAAHFPVRGYITVDGELMPVHFVRQRDDLERLMRDNKRQLIFFSDNSLFKGADLQIDITAPKVFSSTELLNRQWERSWTIHLFKPTLMHERMSAMLSHLNAVRGYQIHKRVLDL